MKTKLLFSVALTQPRQSDVILYWKKTFFKLRDYDFKDSKSIGNETRILQDIHFDQHTYSLY